MKGESRMKLGTLAASLIGLLRRFYEKPNESLKETGLSVGKMFLDVDCTLKRIPNDLSE